MTSVGEYSRDEAADRAGVAIKDLNTLLEHGLVAPDEDGSFSQGSVRKISVLAGLMASRLPVEFFEEGIKSGTLSVDFLDDPVYSIFSAFSRESFDDVSVRTGVPVELLMVIREAIGSAMPEPTDRMREIELEIVPLIEAQLEVGYPPRSVDRLLRTLGDGLRRFIQADTVVMATAVFGPPPHRQRADHTVVITEGLQRMSGPLDQALLAFFRAQQAHVMTAGMLEGIEQGAAQAGLYGLVDRPPAMCFLDITGYTRLTAERGDEAAAELAETLSRLVQRTSVRHGGRPVKWLGDGVMFHFRDPGPGVVAALEMAEGVISAGLPPAHVGLHAGPVLFQDGDYFGQTVNVASRIAEYARPGEVLVSQAVVDAAADAPVTFVEVGPVDLKGVAGPLRLHVAHRGSGSTS